MAKKIYIGNLSFSTTEETLQNLFSDFGAVISATVIKDKVTEQSKGFGFVEMENDDEAFKAISTLNGKELDGRRIRVNEAEEKKPRNFNYDREGSNGGYRNGGRGSFRGGNRGGNRGGYNDRRNDDNSSNNQY